MQYRLKVSYGFRPKKVFFFKKKGLLNYLKHFIQLNLCWAHLNHKHCKDSWWNYLSHGKNISTWMLDTNLSPHRRSDSIAKPIFSLRILQRGLSFKNIHKKCNQFSRKILKAKNKNKNSSKKVIVRKRKSEHKYKINDHSQRYTSLGHPIQRIQ